MILNKFKKIIPIKLKKRLYYFFIILKMKLYYFYSFLPVKKKIFQKGKLTLETRRKYLYIVCPYGIGDILVGAMLANKLKLGKKKIVFLIRGTYLSMDNVLEDIGECVMNTKLASQIETYILLRQQFHGKNYIYGHFAKKKDGSFFRGSVNEYVWQDYCDYVYGMEKDSLFHIIDTSKYKENIIENKEIIICPYAYSTKMLPIKFWEIFVELLQKKGFIIYTNVSRTEEEIFGTKRLECSLYEIIDKVNRCKAVIAMRSGICDLLAIKSMIPLFIINENEGIAKYWNLEYLRNKGIYNFIIDNNLLENILIKMEEAL